MPCVKAQKLPEQYTCWPGVAEHPPELDRAICRFALMEPPEPLKKEPRQLMPRARASRPEAVLSVGAATVVVAAKAKRKAGMGLLIEEYIPERLILGFWGWGSLIEEDKQYR